MAAAVGSNQLQQQQASMADTSKKQLPVFNSYMSLFQVQEKLKKGEVIEGVLRINPKNYEDAYISAPGGGTDIYIGGVRDRNAALHGDLVAVELQHSQHWKVLHDQLDYFLESDETLKEIVYATHDAFAFMDQFVPPNSDASKLQQSSEDISHLKEAAPTTVNTDNTALSNTALSNTELSNTELSNTELSNTEPSNTEPSNTEKTVANNNTENDMAIAGKKKKGRRRGKKNKKKLDNAEELDEGGRGASAAEEVVAGLLADPPVQNVEDELVILSSNVAVSGAAVGLPDDADGKSKKSGKKQTIVVPPDMLSECSDITDDESVCSDSLDLETAIEDRNFFNAQRAATRRANKNAGVVLLGSQDGTSGLRPANIVELPEDDADSTVSVAEEANEHTNLVTPDAVKTESASNVAPNADKKKRVSTAERLFGDKLKKQNDGTVKKCDQEILFPKSETNLKESNNSASKTGIINDPKKNLEQPLKNEGIECKDPKVEEELANLLQAASCNEVPAPRFMVSPYNQQVNFSRTQSRAENNWLNHPMLNNFSNNPTTHGMQNNNPSRSRLPYTSQSNFSPQQQQPHQQQQHRMKQNTPSQEKEQRMEPSVEQVMRLVNWKRFVQKVAYVVHILEPRNTRLAAGTLKPFADMNRNFALFSPNDNRIPRLKIPMQQCPPDFFPRKHEYAKKIYLAKIVRWADPKFAMGELVRDIGRHGDITAESEAYLLQIGIDYSEFPEEVLQDLPTVPSSGWTIPQEALEGRKDFRDLCIFSIDPASARDLDDALSCEELPDGHFRVGVHIADVSYFVNHDTKLDDIAASRATSVYLVDQVIPMLPRVLCEELCSLNPGEDRLAFSVVWEMNSYGTVKSTWFGRSIIRSCGKLSYDHAQSVIDNPGKHDWAPGEMPTISSNFPLSKVCDVITTLQMLAVQMRARRHTNGALRLDQKKLCFNLDQETKMPNAVQTTEHKPSNNLIEEFMLLANISVAHKIHECFPDYAVLRCHPQPHEGYLNDTVRLLRTFDIDIDTSSSGAIYSSLTGLTSHDEFTEAFFEVIVNMLSKPMQNAMYFCSGTWQEDFSHYALNVPFYTHFTSPIRRYPDIMVHRLLAAAIDSERYPLPTPSLDELDRRLSVSNEKKMSAKRASEFSGELFLAEFIRRVQEIHTHGIVIGVLDRALDILLLEYCTIKRAYLEKLPLNELNFDNRNKNNPPAVHVVWSPDHNKQLPCISQSFTYFTIIKVVLTPFTNDQLKFNVTILRPDS